MSGPFRDMRVTAGFGGLDVTMDVKLIGPNDTFHDMEVKFHISDEPLKEIVKRGLERLAGQGKVDEELRAMCHCVGEPRGK